MYITTALRENERKSFVFSSLVVIKLIDPKDYKQYFDWGAVGERVMARALEMYAAHTHKLKMRPAPLL